MFKMMVKQFMIGFQLPWIFAVIIFFHSIPAISENSVADEIISLNAAGQPLGEVLKNISTAANCRFSIDGSWEDYPITAAFDNEPLHRGLKLIFRNINNAVIYGEDRTIKIIIYDQSPDADIATGHSITIKASQESIRQSQPFSEATAPQPEVEISEEDSGPESDMKESEDATEPGVETAEADSDNPEAAEEAFDASREKDETTE
jgi:hypothetical protein